MSTNPVPKESRNIIQLILESIKARSLAIWKALEQNNLWKRIVKNVVCTTATIGICLIHTPDSPFGSAAYLAAIMTVATHPGVRLGQLVESLSLAVAGSFLGVGWSILGIYLSSLVILSSPPAAYAIRGIFLAIGLLLHGYLRSHTPRLFIFVLLLVLVCIIGFTTTATHVTPTYVTQLVYPILLASGVILFVNIFIFPEFSSGFIGKTTIDTLAEIATVLQDAGQYFVQTESSRTNGAAVPNGPSVGPKDAEPTISPSSSVRALSDLTGAKSRLRAKVSACKAAQNECQYELAFSVLPPEYMGPVNKQAMSKLLANTIAVIGACESRFALLGDFSAEPKEDTVSTRPRASARSLQYSDGRNKLQLELIKPKREIEYGDVHLLRQLVDRVKEPYIELNTIMMRAVDVVSSCLAYTYSVPKLPSGARTPAGILLEELDQHCDTLEQALQRFDTDITAALDDAAPLQDFSSEEPDMMPREEIFLISSFLLNFRQAVAQVEEMLKYSRGLVEKRQHTRGRRRLFMPKIHWRRWLYSGGEEVEGLPARGRKAARQGKSGDHMNETGGISGGGNGDDKKYRHDDLEARTEGGREQQPPNTVCGSMYQTPGRKQQALTLSLRIRGHLADVVDWIQDSEDLAYALKLTIAAFLVTWPTLVPSLNMWYSLNRGTWAALQLVFVFEVEIGTSIMSFFLRSIGTTLGSLWGWAAFETRSSNPVVCVAMLFIGLIPAVYVQLGSQHAKAGMVAIISMSVVAVSTELQTVPGTGTENFLKRWIAFLIGGAVAILVQMLLLPVKARDQLVESLTAAITKIGEMEGCIAYGAEDGVNIKGFPHGVLVHFEHASGEAKTALAAASTFLPFCSTEPRLKGPFSPLAKIYTEVLFVLHQIIDKMENMLQMRTEYGSGPLEDFNAMIYPYRRNIAGCITLILYAVQEALTTKLPLPQFLPSARVAHVRLIKRVRDVVRSSTHAAREEQEPNSPHRRALRRKYVSWNASGAAQAEIIEYLEELTDLTKLLVGANEFQSGVLRRMTFEEYVAKGRKGEKNGLGSGMGVGGGGGGGEAGDGEGLRKRRSPTVGRETEDGDVPHSLRRIQTRKYDAEIRRRRTNEG